MVLESRDANRQDASFLAWVLLTAHRSHLERGMWDLVVDGEEADCVRFLEHLAATSLPHWAHFSTFLVAEVDGVPAAALCGYFEAELGMPALAKALPEVNAALGRSEAEGVAGYRRAGSIVHVAPEHEPGVWIVENVATRPEYRRRGLIDRLLAEILERGRQLGARVADIGVLIGNDPAQRAYEKNGFAVVGEKRHPEFEAAYRCPGIRALSRAL
jgi:translation initiation factor 4G